MPDNPMAAALNAVKDQLHDEDPAVFHGEANPPCARCEARTRAAAYREAANDLEADADQLGPWYHRTAGLRSAAELLRTRADEIAPPTA